MGFWDGYFVEDFKFDSFPSGAKVLDVGCGTGHQITALLARGALAVGVDFSPVVVNECVGQGLNVICAPAEELPYEAESFDGIVCKVVLPYTDESAAIAEWSRVLRKDGTILASYHGAGYYLKYLLQGANWKEQVYGARSLVNGWVYAAVGKRLPYFWGDTIYQSESRLLANYQRAGLAVLHRVNGKTFAGFPVFIYHQLRKM